MSVTRRKKKRKIYTRPEPGVESMRVRLDGWGNDWTGLGVSTDKTTQGTFRTIGTLGDALLSALYHQSDVAQRLVDIVPDEMFRKGFSVSYDDDAERDKELNKRLRKLGLRAKMQDAARWGRLFGGAALIIGADDGQNADRQLVNGRVRRVEWLRVADKRELQPLTYYETGEKAGEPETYTYSPLGQVIETSRTIHESRLVTFGGMTTARIEKAENSGWDFSILQPIYEVMRSYDTGWRSVDHLLTDAHQAVFKMVGLANALAQPDGQDLVEARMRLIDRQRSVGRPLVLDAGDTLSGEPGESFERQSVSFTEVPAVLDKLMLRLAQAGRVPVTILMGQSPAGMNATGESDFRWFYDQIGTDQENDMTPRVERICDVILQSQEFGLQQDSYDVSVCWASLWSETPQQQATTRKILLEGDAIAADKGFLLPEEVTLSRYGGEGFGAEIQLSEEALETRRKVLELELEQAEEKAEEPDQEPPESTGENPEDQPVGEAPEGDEGEEADAEADAGVEPEAGEDEDEEGVE